MIPDAVWLLLTGGGNQFVRLLQKKKAFLSLFYSVWQKSSLFKTCNQECLFLHIGIDEISEDVYKGVDHSDSEDSEKSDSSDSEYLSDEEHKPKSSIQNDKDKAERKRPKASTEGEIKEGVTGKVEKTTTEPVLKDKQGSNGPERDLQDKPRTPQSQPLTDKPKAPEEGRAAAATSVAEQDSDSERELVIDLGDEQGGNSKRARREPGASAAKTPKESNVAKSEGEAFWFIVYIFSSDSNYDFFLGWRDSWEEVISERTNISFSMQCDKFCILSNTFFKTYSPFCL